MSLSNVLRKLDAYPKTFDEVSDKTLSGAVVTLISRTIMFILILTEFNAFLSTDITEELFVDTTRSHKLKINLDIYVPSISCNYVSLDAMDSAGDQHLHIEHNVFKRRVDLSGNPISESTIKEEVSKTQVKIEEKISNKNSTDVQEVTCGSCYGAQQNDTHCCNSCQDVIDAYREKRWNPNTNDFVQCKDEKIHDREKADAAFKEGCQIYGQMEVNRMGGSFHVAPGKSFSLNHVHVHDVQPFSSSTFNTSHVINHLSFGERINFANTHPLDSLSVTATEGAMMFQYYIKIVPTMYIKQNGQIVNTNQFSVTRHQKSVSIVSGESGMPGVFFSYELSPLMVKYTERRRSISHCLTNIVVIIGGLHVVAGIIDSFIHNFILNRKVELGKAS